MHSFGLSTVIFLLSHLIVVVNSIRCSTGCDFVGFPLNISIPIEQCVDEERDHAECTFNAIIDFGKKFVGGAINIRSQTAVASLSAESSFRLDQGSVISTVRYTCTMSDFCNFAFLSELMTNRLAELDVAAIQEKLLNLLYEPTPKPQPIQCFQGVCPANHFCQAILSSTVTPEDNLTIINSSLPCIEISSTDTLLEITQTFLPSDSKITVMKVRCNQNTCNSNAIVTQVYEFLRNEYVLPMNYSILNMTAQVLTTTLPTSGAAHTFLSCTLLSLLALIFSRCL